MSKTRSSTRGRGSRLPADGERRRRRRIWRPLATAGLCAVAAGALLHPGLAFGTGSAAADDLSAAGKRTSRVETTAPTLSKGDLLVTLPWGTAQGQVGLERPREGLSRGPEAVAVAPDGRIALLDAVNSRLVTLDASGGFVRTIAVELTQPRFLAVTDERLYVLDCDADGLLLSVDWTGERQRLSELPTLEDVVTGLLATDEGVCVELAHDRVFLATESVELTAAAFTSGQGRHKGKASFRQLSGRPLGHRSGRSAKVVLGADKKVRVKSFKTERGSLKTTATGEATPEVFTGMPIDHLVSVDGDGAGGVVFGARLAETGGTRAGASLVLTRWTESEDADTAPPERRDRSRRSSSLDSSGRGAGPLLLADCSFAYLGQPYVVAPDGRVIQPLADENGYSLMVHEFTDPEEVAR